jgi:hypothetical protein
MQRRRRCPLTSVLRICVAAATQTYDQDDDQLEGSLESIDR